MARLYPELYKPEIKALIADLYLNQGDQPQVIVDRLKAEHGIDVPSTTLRQLLRREGHTSKRKEIDARIEAQLAPAAVAETRVAAMTGHLERWAGKAAAVVDRGLDAATTSGSLRDMNTATKVASTAMRMAMVASGIESPQAKSSTFNIFYAQEEGSPFRTVKPVHEEKTIEVDPA